jgi:hypothetical protein
LEVALEEGVIIFDNYVAVCASDLFCLVSLPTEDGGLYHIVADASFALEDGINMLNNYCENYNFLVEYIIYFLRFIM